MIRKGFAQIPLMIGLLIMAVAVPVATKLVQTNQENRGRAAAIVCGVNEPCDAGYKCLSGKCVLQSTTAPTARPTQASCVDTLWLDTSTCTKTCGGGTKTQRSNCTRTRTISCNTQACPTPTSAYCNVKLISTSACGVGSCKDTEVQQTWRNATCGETKKCVASDSCKTAVCSTGQYKCFGTVSTACLSGQWNGVKKDCGSLGCDTSTGKCKPAATATLIPGGTGAKCKAAGGRCLNFNSLGSSVCGDKETQKTMDCPVVKGYNTSVQGCCLPKAIEPCSSNGCSTKGETGSCTYTLIGVPGVPTGTKVTGTHTCNLDVFNNCLTWSECKGKYITLTPTNVPTKKLSPEPAIPTLSKCPTNSITVMGYTICGRQQELVARINGGVCCKEVGIPFLTKCPTNSITVMGYTICGRQQELVARISGGVCCRNVGITPVVTSTPTTIPTAIPGVLKCYCDTNCGNYDCNWQTAAGGGFNRICETEYCKYIPTPKITAVPTIIPKPTAINTPIPGCIAGTACLPAGKVCCSGYSQTVLTSICSSGKRCAVPPTLRPPTSGPTGSPYKPTIKPTIKPTVPPTGKCTQCANLPKAKKKGDADCSGITNINDISIWRSEFISGDLGSVVRNKWRADFDCNGKVNLNDFSIWRDNFIKSL